MKKINTLMKASIFAMGIAIFVMSLAISGASAYQAAPPSSDRAKEMMAKNAAKKAAKDREKQFKKMSKGKGGNTVVVVEEKDLIGKLEDAAIGVIVEEITGKEVKRKRRIN